MAKARRDLTPQEIDAASPSKANGYLARREITDTRRAIGVAIEVACARVRKTQEQVADELGMDRGQFGKWISGVERPQLDRICDRYPEFYDLVLVELAKLSARIEVVTSLRVRERSGER